MARHRPSRRSARSRARRHGRRRARPGRASSNGSGYGPRRAWPSFAVAGSCTSFSPSGQIVSSAIVTSANARARRAACGSPPGRGLVRLSACACVSAVSRAAKRKSDESSPDVDEEPAPLRGSRPEQRVKARQPRRARRAVPPPSGSRCARSATIAGRPQREQRERGERDASRGRARAIGAPR